ncbi:MAG: hypothetical protein KGN16_02955 [Burkholderiales bacterium]|nr:hypothetical protein [Burkholderiales bacterium]
MSGLRAWLASIVVLTWFASAARAEPYLALAQNLPCVACHVNPTGGGMRNAAGVAFAQYALPAYRLPDALMGWTGGLGPYVRVGGDLRSDATTTDVPGRNRQRVTGLQQWRLYGDLQLIPDRVGIYLDEQMGPGNRLVEERYLRLSTPGMGWYLKAGQFYLPFGWRLQDNQAFVREVSGIGMTTPDRGVELGLERDGWSAQLVWSDGPGNQGRVSGHQVTAQVVKVASWWRIGVATASTVSTAGNRRVDGLFGGLHLGPLVWFGEIDRVRDAGYPEGTRSLLAALGEVDWPFAPGFNLKLTGEYFDPDRHVAHDEKVRRSLVLEYAPLPFMQWRAGIRRYIGIPQNDIDNRKLAFVEWHLLF